jgi:hypothetical protein
MKSAIGDDHFVLNNFLAVKEGMTCHGVVKGGVDY